MSESGEIIRREVNAFRVSNWLDGSKAKSDRVTRAALERAGYVVVSLDLLADISQHLYRGSALGVRLDATLGGDR